jgi:hypothetical protein
VVAFAGVGLAGLGHSWGTVSAASPALSVTTQTTPPPSSSPTPSLPDPAAALGPYGAAGVFLGEPLDELFKTSKVNGTPIVATQKSGDGCIAYTMIVPADVTPQRTPPVETTSLASPPLSPPFTSPTGPGPSETVAPKPGALSIVVAPKAGVVQIGGIIALRTPEGVALGTNSGLLYRIYPGIAADSTNGRLVVAAPGGKGAQYVFAIGRDHDVAELWLRGPATYGCRS